MKIHLHIERVQLDGVPAEQPDVVRGALQAELVRRLVESGIAPELRSRSMVPRVSGGTMRVGREAHSAQIGRQIAAAVHRGIGGSQ